MYKTRLRKTVTTDIKSKRDEGGEAELLFTLVSLSKTEE